MSFLRTAMLLPLALICIGGVARAQDLYPEVEYISGHENMTDKQKGTLLIGDSELKFTKKDGTILFAVPFSEVTEVSNQSDIRDASVGKKLLWGGLAGSRKQEFLQVAFETDKMAEGLVFKVKQGTSAGMVAKIKFAVKKAKGEPPVSSTTVSQSVVPLQSE